MLKLFQSLKYIWVGLILYLTLKQGGGESFFEFLKYPGVDKLGHFWLFFIWALLYFPELLMPKQLEDQKPVKFWIVATNSLVLGVLIEAAQYYIPGRSSEYMDVGADVLGTVTALVAVKLLRLKKSNLK